MERLSAELAQATRDRVSDAIHVGELQGQLRHLTGAHLSCERMMGRLVKERNEAWHREDVARERVEELEFYVNDLEGDNQILHEEVHQLYYQLHPPPRAVELDPVVILADGGESEEEFKEEDPEEVELVDESDDEGGHVSRMDTDHKN
jgi:hypothetical protein